MNKQGFTLIELLVVIAIIGVLAGVVMVAINPATRMAEARDSGIKSDIGQIATAMEAYYTRNETYPATVGALVTSDDLKSEPLDPDGNSYSIGTAGEPLLYGDLKADASEGCTASGADAYYCYETANGEAGVVCSAPTATSNDCGTFQP